MRLFIKAKDKAAGTFLGSLARDRRGNTLAMMAAALFPICALAGSAVDMSRLYLVRVRLQQACDAGVLAGRRVMPDSNNTALDQPTISQAQAFFGNNFTNGWLGTSATVFTPVKTAGNQVSAIASTSVPMTIMRMFSAPDRTLTVSCLAEFNVPDTDVMFVLDTTGSMACLPSHTSQQCNNYVDDNPATQVARPGAGTQPGYAVTPGYAGSNAWAVPEAPTGSRIAELRAAVQTFYSTMAGEVDPLTNVRYGFVTYSSSINPGQAVLDVAPAMLRGTGASGTTTAPYQSRELMGEYGIDNRVSTRSLSQANCTAIARSRSPSPTQQNAFPFTTAQRATYTSRYWSTANNRCEVLTETMGPRWVHRIVNHNVAGFVTGGTVADPTKLTGATATWFGCIEERETTARTLNYNWRTLPADLDPDLVPTMPTQLWAPYWPEVVYQKSLNRWNGTSFNDDTVNGDDDDGDSRTQMNYFANQRGGFVTCGKPVQRLATLTAAQINAYVTAADFVPHGGTYHDAGMIWGVRMLSPTGPFRADTARWPGRAEPNRVLVFLTDGDMSPSLTSYTFKGMELFDQRVSGTDLGNLTAYHDARFLAVCEWARNNRIDVWTVSITTAQNPNANLTACANTPAQAFSTRGQPGRLGPIFQQIARQVAALRVGQ